MPIATGAVTDLGASEITATGCTPSDQAIATALSADVTDPQSRLTPIASADDWTDLGGCRK